MARLWLSNAANIVQISQRPCLPNAANSIKNARLEGGVGVGFLGPWQVRWDSERMLASHKPAWTK